MEAFNHVAGSVHTLPMGGMGPPIWADIKPVLELYDLWNADVQGRLADFMAKIRSVFKAEHPDDHPAPRGGEVWQRKS